MARKQTTTPECRLAEVTRQLFALEDLIIDLEGASSAILDATETENANGSHGPHWIAGKLCDAALRLRNDYNAIIAASRDPKEAAANAAIVKKARAARKGGAA